MNEQDLTLVLDDQRNVHINTQIIADDYTIDLNDDGFRMTLDNDIVQLFDSDNNIICKCIYRCCDSDIVLKQGWIYYPDIEKKYVYFMTSSNSLTISNIMSNDIINVENIVENIKDKLSTHIQSSVIYVYDRNGKEVYSVINL